MALFKCKMCGGDLNLTEGASTAECGYCGSVQTVPKADDEKKLTLFARANRLRAACEFDKAAGVYEAIVADFPEEAEAYWGLVLCKYGIEYVDDPATGKKIPTCHRSSFDSIMDDSDLDQALENADSAARKVYRDEAKTIEEIRKGIIAVSANEEPYDIFICYKESAENGERTLDSVLAQDIYDALTEKGYRVFFSRISLEDKLGLEYEPYIFAALNSAKIMLVFGTDYEYFNAVWVKNEWHRYLKLMAKDKAKHLIPCYKGIDAYDMPKEFAKLQAQDLGKVGAVQDLLRGINKLLPRQVHDTDVTLSQPYGQANNIAPLLKRGQMALEDNEWENADRFFEEVLNLDPECSEAYLGKVLAANKVVALEHYVEQRIASTENIDKIYTLFADYPEQLATHVKEMVSKYKVLGQLSEKEIAEHYENAPVMVDSSASVRLKQLQEEVEFWEGTKALARAIRYDKTGKIKRLKEKLLSVMQRRLDDTKVIEQSITENLAIAYQQFLEAADAAVIAKYQQFVAPRRKTEADIYATANSLLLNGSSLEHFKLAKEMFLSIANYGNSSDKALECDEKREILLARMKRNELLNKELISIRSALLEKTGFFNRKEREQLLKREKEIMMILDPFSK